MEEKGLARAPRRPVTVSVAGRRAGEARLDGTEHDSVLGPSRRPTPSVSNPERAETIMVRTPTSQ